MTERERNEAQPDVDPDDPDVRRTSNGPRPEHTDRERPTDQAISNQEQALESGEENVG